MTKANGLPRGVHEKHGAYYLVRANRWHKLCRVREGLPQMYRALAALIAADERRGSMPEVIAQWCTDKRADWAPKTAVDQERIASVMCKRLAEFGPSQMTTPVCAEYLASYRATPRTYNMHRTMLHAVLDASAIAGLRDGHNPVAPIKRMQTAGRHRIVTDDEIQRLKAAALQQSRNGEALAQMIDLALLTGQRIGDALRMRWQDVGADGITVVQGKGKGRVRLLIEWTPALRAAVDACADGRERIGHLLKTQSGGPYTYGGIRSAWVRACARAGIEDLTIHDLRGRAGVDALEGDGQDIRTAQRLLGHTSEAMTRHYVDGKFSRRVRAAK